jgi:hypothetical protein
MNTCLALIPLKKNNRLGPYLAGLIEGDGSIYVPIKNKTPSGSLNLGSFEICFDLKDYPLAEKIKLEIGGLIRIRGKACILTIKKTQTVFNLINLINGHMRTPKIEALHRLIIWFNNKHGTNIALLPLDESPLQSNSWLSGILDADGGFYFNFLMNKNDLPISLQFYLRLSQRQYYHRDSFVGKSYIYIMNKFANFISVPLRTINRIKKSGYTELAFEVRSGSYLSKYIILSYLTQYPLLSYKFIHIPIQISLFKLANAKLYHSIEGLKFLKINKEKISNYISSEHWNHLNDNFPIV